MPRFVEGQDRHQVTLLPESLDEFITEDSAETPAAQANLQIAAAAAGCDVVGKECDASQYRKRATIAPRINAVDQDQRCKARRDRSSGAVSVSAASGRGTVIA